MLPTMRGDGQLENLLGFARRKGALLLGFDAVRRKAERRAPMRVFAHPELAARTLRDIERFADARSGVQAAVLADFEQRTSFLRKRAVKVVAVADPAFRRGLDRYFPKTSRGEQGGCQE